MSDFDQIERRKNPRVSLEDEHSVSVFADLSRTGVMLEVSRPLHGEVARLKLDLGQDRVLDVKGRVVRHYVHGFEVCDDGRTIVKYRVAIDPSDLC